MSHLQRAFARVHLQKLPPAPLILDEDEDEDEDAQTGRKGDNYEEENDDDDDGDEITNIPELPSPSKYDSSSSTSSTGTIVPTPSQNLFEKPSITTTKTRYSPLFWQDFYAQELFLVRTVGDLQIQHHAYLTSPTANAPLIVTHHGAGSSGLSFAACTKAIQKAIPNAGVLSLDARGHGQTTVRNQYGSSAALDLSLTTLALDLAFVVHATQQKLQWPKLPPIILLGHSLGGAVVTEVAYTKLLGSAVLGYGVLDVVEGSAMDALKSMEQYLLTRPRSFPSLTSAIEWHTRSRTIRDLTSARISVPSLLEQRSAAAPYTWITDLSATKPFWENWFIGLSRKFLAVPAAGKLLILAGTDRLDKELMIGQMQGRYQLQVFPEAGHFVHEDQPEKTAVVVGEFWRRNDRSALVLPPKVDELIKQGKIKAANHNTH